LVVEPVRRREHEDRYAASGFDDAFGDLVAGGPGDVAIEDGDGVVVDTQQAKSGVTVTSDVGGDRFQAQAGADGFCQVAVVLDDQHPHAPDATSRGHIADVSKISYVLATPGRFDLGA